ncbi:hypothetical protein COCMIDRAFT_22431 [Bipolaris oryzae ATCC 44560]|uniref:Uncharacterized protein n=1 Tax=Bipolaris oryzae ATCC 44560 TaxID=930090 RepID=W6ZJ91_COCMI|nr:uncharacterized protein COCMIDRAFT_22431 [Bipolaris oryzae ATCC 44560]EUC50110.1 hypothetical protein COCMIDRAFT_22431 [Bipolaris oryzae ATCC 44560]
MLATNIARSIVTPGPYMNATNPLMTSSANDTIVSNESSEPLSVAISFGVLGLVVAMHRIRLIQSTRLSFRVSAFFLSAFLSEGYEDEDHASYSERVWTFRR